VSPRARTLILLLFVLLALLVGFTAGYRARISQEVINVYPNGRFLPPVPPDLSVVWP
jgi:hypothetical protein